MQDSMIKINPKVLDILLKDRTTKRNIIWATDDYMTLGIGYFAKDSILSELITGVNASIIQPRISKEQQKQLVRTRKKAEVFTPSWICNNQNNLVDSQWFGREDVFNFVCHGDRTWQSNPEKIIFPDQKNKSWMHYVDARRMEITCGEAPYLVSRYDSVSGKFIDIKDRIGMLDRKIRVVTENTESEADWLKWVYRAYESIYGYEFQGDNLLLARKNLLYTFAENLRFVFDRDATQEELAKIAKIVSWNLWQMDGIKGVVPYLKNKEPVNRQLTFFDTLDSPDETEENSGSDIFCKIRDWRANSTIVYKSLMKGA